MVAAQVAGAVGGDGAREALQDGSVEAEGLVDDAFEVGEDFEVLCPASLWSKVLVPFIASSTLLGGVARPVEVGEGDGGGVGVFWLRLHAPCEIVPSEGCSFSLVPAIWRRRSCRIKLGCCDGDFAHGT